MLPVIEALTSWINPALSAIIAIINSAALPNVAFRNPPMVGPVFAARCSVASPRYPASGITATPATMNTTNGELKIGATRETAS